MDLKTANLLESLSEDVLEFANEGKWNEAMRLVDAAVERARSSKRSKTNGILFHAATLEIKADLLRRQDLTDDALDIYLEAYEMLDGTPESSKLLALVSASIGVIYDFADNNDNAITYYEKAIEMYEQATPPKLEEVAEISNNLGFIYRNLDDMDTAETLFLKGLEIYHNAYGKNHEKTAILLSNLGSLYLKSGHNEQAREMHKMSLEGRLSVLGSDHPDTAQSYLNLALSLAELGDNKQSKQLFLKSLAIYEKHILTKPREYEAVAGSYAEFLRASEDVKGSAKVMKLAKNKLARV